MQLGLQLGADVDYLGGTDEHSDYQPKSGICVAIPTLSDHTDRPANVATVTYRWLEEEHRPFGIYHDQRSDHTALGTVFLDNRTDHGENPGDVSRDRSGGPGFSGLHGYL